MSGVERANEGGTDQARRIYRQLGTLSVHRNFPVSSQVNLSGRYGRGGEILNFQTMASIRTTV